MTKIIAELCQNHNGDMSILKEMVHAAKESGADFAKIQSLLSSDLTHRSRFDLGEEENGITKVIKRPFKNEYESCLLYTSPSPRDGLLSRMPSSA